MAKLGSKKVAEDLGNDDLAKMLKYLRGRGWFEVGSAITAEGFARNPLKDNRDLLDRLVDRMLASGNPQARLDYNDLLQQVRNQRHKKSNEINGINTLSCDLCQQAYGNLLKLVKRTAGTKRSVVENFLLHGDDTLRREISILKNEKEEQVKKFRRRDEKIKKKEKQLMEREEKLEDHEKQIADFKKNAQSIIDLLRDVGQEGNADVIGAFKPILEALREIGEKDGADLTVRDTTNEAPARSYSGAERNLEHNLCMLMSLMKAQNSKS